MAGGSLTPRRGWGFRPVAARARGARGRVPELDRPRVPVNVCRYRTNLSPCHGLRGRARVASSREPAGLAPRGGPGPAGVLARSSGRRGRASRSASCWSASRSRRAWLQASNWDGRVDDRSVAPGSAGDCWRSDAHGPVQHLSAHRQRSTASKQAALGATDRLSGPGGALVIH